jgi:hypothetical protein
MLMRKQLVLLAAAASLIAGNADGQQHQQTPSEQALGAKLMQEIQGGLICNASLISVQAELAKAQARIKELEPKPASPEK